jgi:hypothetical protein
MYAVINHFPLTIPVEELRGPLEDSGLPLISSLRGFRGVLCVAETEKDAAMIILWDTEEDAINGGRAMGPTWFHEHVAPYLAGEQQRSVGKVIVSRFA